MTDDPELAGDPTAAEQDAFFPDREREIEKDPLYARICVAGQTLRRIDRAEKRDNLGRRSVWHQGHELTELLSWEGQDGSIEHQELTFIGFQLDVVGDDKIRTGTVQDAKTEAGMPSADMVEYDPVPSMRLLELAAQLLREAKRDYYTQNALKMVNAELTRRFNRPQTQVLGLTRWKKKLRRTSQKLFNQQRRRRQILIYVGCGMALGAIITLALLAMS